ncbi:hypothetical protein [Paenibacillus nasutitermitis]|uniref:Uncharacterized protein n=1 Tax=Paenibacillus nasutitermitis TaxID=1652958 RepID=A0A916ZJY4_9BACL|nr:hypothetical protein [Paenibacillus nasutitermitis]GGE01607.1 hypothetical protein GCM10010911_70670 [Paenibacillus nasutitermitis]
MKISRVLRFISAILEACLGIPIVGGLFVISMSYSPLMFMFVLHLITLFFCFRERSGKIGSIAGIVTSLLAWIPILGMIMHILSAIILFISAASDRESRNLRQ